MREELLRIRGVIVNQKKLLQGLQKRGKPSGNILIIRLEDCDFAVEDIDKLLKEMSF